MSFSFSTQSRELESALNYATARGVVAVASTGNNGQRINVYPAALSNVIGVASSTDWDTLSHFSNYGTERGVDCRTRRGDRQHVSVRQLRCRVGHVVQHAVRGRHRRAAGRAERRDHTGAGRRRRRQGRQDLGGSEQGPSARADRDCAPGRPLLRLW